METCNKTQQIVVRIACHLSVIMGAGLNLWVNKNMNNSGVKCESGTGN
jgi:hypothetical protein